MGCVALDFCSLWIKFWQNLIAFFQRKVMIAAWMNQHRPRWVFFPLFSRFVKVYIFPLHFQIFKLTADERAGSPSLTLFLNPNDRKVLRYFDFQLRLRSDPCTMSSTTTFRPWERREPEIPKRILPVSGFRTGVEKIWMRTDISTIQETYLYILSLFLFSFF